MQSGIHPSHGMSNSRKFLYFSYSSMIFVAKFYGAYHCVISKRSDRILLHIRKNVGFPGGAHPLQKESIDWRKSEWGHAIMHSGLQESRRVGCAVMQNLPPPNNDPVRRLS